MYPGNLFFFGNNGYGVAAQNELDDTSTGGGGPFAFGGDFASSGYLNWQDATNVGTNQGWVAERNIISFLGTTDGAVDSYYGAKFTFRFNNVKIQNSCAGGVGWNHGTDSGSFRSNVSMEIYGNYFDNETGGACAIGNSRGGTTMYFSNTHVGNAAWGNLNQQTYRCLGQASSANWGLACNTTASTPYPALNLNWTPVSPTITSSNATVVTLNAPDWQASHAYTCSTGTPCAIGPTSNNAAGYNYISTSNCTTSGTRPSFNQTFPPTTTTSDGSCSWLNVGGVLAASANPSVGGFLSTAPDTTCSSGGTCNYYMDGLGSTGYPLRDQIGRGHNQVLMPDYEWLNAGAEAPASVYSTDSGTTGIIASNRDYYSYTGSFTGATGVGSGSTGSRPSTCTTGTAYWNTSEGTWNNGAAGSGALDVCTSTNTWTSASYTPYTYPDPLIGGGASTAAGSLLPGSQLMRGAQMIQ
jgi:hypothetical protein